MKKIVGLVLCLPLLLIGVVNVSATSYEEAVKSANLLADHKIINNHKKDPWNYNLNQKVLRQEIAAVTRALAWLEKSTSCKGYYWDVNSKHPNSWACYSIEPLREKGLISKNKYFNPTKNITKAEALWMVVSSCKLAYSYQPGLSTSWQVQVMEFAYKKGLSQKFYDFNQEATRGFVFDAAAICYDKYILKSKTEAELPFDMNKDDFDAKRIVDQIIEEELWEMEKKGELE